MESGHVALGVCGLSCRLCPAYHRQTQSRCPGCKSAFRQGAACPFVTCAVKKQGVEFCWQCNESQTCARWKKHAQDRQAHDSFVCYQKIDSNIATMQTAGVDEFEKQQAAREKLLKQQMLAEFDEGRSKSFYCVAGTVLEVGELEGALEEARKKAEGLQLKEKAKVMHTELDRVAKERGYLLKLRK
jgi:hypothetical protein